MTKTISMLTILVTVLITNCQVSLQWKSGPVTNQTKVIKQMATNAELEPASFAVFCAMLANPCFLVIVIHHQREAESHVAVRRFLQKEKRALRRDRLIYFSNTFSIWPTFFWTLPASFSFWPSVDRLELFVTCHAFSSFHER